MDDFNTKLIKKDMCTIHPETVSIFLVTKVSISKKTKTGENFKVQIWVNVYERANLAGQSSAKTAASEKCVPLPSQRKTTSLQLGTSKLL